VAFKMFVGEQLDGKFKNKDSTAARRACSIGRIVNVCKYLEMPETRVRLDDTILALEQIL